MWVETDSPCTVEVLGLPRAHLDRRRPPLRPGRASRGWRRAPARRTTSGWTARWSGRRRTRDAPPSRIRTLGPGPAAAARRSAPAATPPPPPSASDSKFDADALDAYAARMARSRPRTSGPTRCCCSATRSTPTRPPRAPGGGSAHAATSPTPPGDAGARTSRSTPGSTTSRWSDPEVRWLLSTVPSSMIFDDHDVRDDWNTSAAWRREMQATPWWEERIIGGAVVVLGLPAPGQPLPADAGRGRRSTSGSARTTATPSRCCASSPRRPTRRPTGTRGRSGRTGATSGGVAAAGDRLPLRADARQRRPLDGVRGRVRAGSRSRLAGDYDHLLVGTSLPWLLPRALHDLESWNERARARDARPPAGRLRREGAPGGRPGALGRVPGVLRPARRAVRAGRTRRARRRGRPGAGHDLRPVRRRAPRLRRRRRTTASR